MYSKIALFVASAFALAAMAAPGGTPPPTGVSQCNVGEMHCCNSVEDAESDIAQKALGGITVPVGAVTGQVGLTCTPIGVLGLGGNSCTAQPVCCTGNSFSGLVVIGCSPININL